MEMICKLVSSCKEKEKCEHSKKHLKEESCFYRCSFVSMLSKDSTCEDYFIHQIKEAIKNVPNKRK